MTLDDFNDARLNFSQIFINTSKNHVWLLASLDSLIFTNSLIILILVRFSDASLNILDELKYTKKNQHKCLNEN